MIELYIILFIMLGSFLTYGFSFGCYQDKKLAQAMSILSWYGLFLFAIHGINIKKNVFRKFRLTRV